MAGVWTSVCVLFPALDAKAAGFKVIVGRLWKAIKERSRLFARKRMVRRRLRGVD